MFTICKSTGTSGISTNRDAYLHSIREFPNYSPVLLPEGIRLFKNNLTFASRLAASETTGPVESVDDGAWFGNVVYWLLSGHIVKKIYESRAALKETIYV